MRSPTERALWAAVAVALLAAAAAGWWTADQWLPQAGPTLQDAWRKTTRPGPDTLPPDRKAVQGAQPAQGAASAPAPRPRKCVQGSRIIYTDQPCPPGSQEQGLDGGALTSLPR